MPVAVEAKCRNLLPHNVGLHRRFRTCIDSDLYRSRVRYLGSVRVPPLTHHPDQCAHRAGQGHSTTDHTQQKTPTSMSFTWLRRILENGMYNLRHWTQAFHCHIRLHAILYHIIQQLSIVIQLPLLFCFRQALQLRSQLLQKFILCHHAAS